MPVFLMTAWTAAKAILKGAGWKILGVAATVAIISGLYLWIHNLHAELTAAAKAQTVAEFNLQQQQQVNQDNLKQIATITAQAAAAIGAAQSAANDELVDEDFANQLQNGVTNAKPTDDGPVALVLAHVLNGMRQRQITARTAAPGAGPNR